MPLLLPPHRCKQEGLVDLQLLDQAECLGLGQMDNSAIIQALEQGVQGKVELTK